MSRVEAQPAEKAPGTLDDYAFTVHACIDAWLASGNMDFYRTGVKLADAMIARFYDATAGAFYDAAASERRADSAGGAGGAAQTTAGFADAGRKSDGCLGAVAA